MAEWNELINPYMRYLYLWEMKIKSKSITFEEVLVELMQGNVRRAGRIINKEYPFKPFERVQRRYTQVETFEVFLRDGFIDRYAGTRLIFPGVLRAMSILLPKEFPWHPNWKTDECHIAFWELSPTIDHLVPIAKGGDNDSSNLLTTSMTRNKAKSIWTLEDLGWKLYPPGNLEKWDGMISHFIALTKRFPELLECTFIKKWDRTLKSSSFFP